MTANVDVVVFDEDKFFRKLPIAHQLSDLLQHPFTRFVEGMRLSGENKLHRPFRIIDHARNFFNVPQNQIGALVSGKTPREANGERIRTECAFQLLQYGTRLFAPGGLLDGAAANKIDELRLQIKMRFPELAIVDVVDAFPYFGFAAVLLPSRAEVAIVKAEHLWS